MAGIKTVVNVGKRIGERQGFSDGGHIELRCSSCGKGLVDIWITKPDEIDPRTRQPFEWDVLAHCCYCGDHSFITKVHGGFHHSGFGSNHPDDTEVAVLETVISDIKDDPEGVIHLYTEKASK